MGVTGQLSCQQGHIHLQSVSHRHHGVGNHIRAIGFAAMRVWRQEGRIGLHQNVGLGHHCQSLTQSLRIFEGDGARKRGIPAVLTQGLGQSRISTKAVKHSLLRCAHLEKDLHDGLVGIAIVDLQGQVMFLGQSNMVPKRLFLKFLKTGLGSKEIQPRLPHRDHSGMGRERVQDLHGVVEPAGLG